MTRKANKWCSPVGDVAAALRYPQSAKQALGQRICPETASLSGFSFAA